MKFNYLKLSLCSILWFICQISASVINPDIPKRDSNFDTNFRVKRFSLSPAHFLSDLSSIIKLTGLRYGIRGTEWLLNSYAPDQKNARRAMAEEIKVFD